MSETDRVSDTREVGDIVTNRVSSTSYFYLTNLFTQLVSSHPSGGPGGTDGEEVGD